MIQEYISYIRNLKGYSNNTAVAYEKDIKAFVRWMQQHTPSARWSGITRTDIDSYITYLSAKGYAPSTTNRAISAISGLYGFMKRNGYEVTNPCTFESRRKQEKKIPNTIDIKQLRTAYINSVGVTKTMLGLLITTGIRIQELLDLTWESINFSSGAIKIQGKGAKQRIVYTNEKILADLQNVFEYCKPSGKMFHIEQRDARRMIWEALKPYCNAPQLSPHAIRHTMATYQAAQGQNVAAIAKMLGHNNIETTQKYIDMADVNLRDAMQQYTIIN